jgi:SAM-dependent methyltransferase
MRSDFSDIKERVTREVEFYDHQQLQRDEFETGLAYLNNGIGWRRRNEVIQTALHDAIDAQVLEIGSQSWEQCLFRYGYRPARLTCINVSQSELDLGRMRAAQLGMVCDFRRMDAHNLEFEDGSLDVVFGIAILHHLEFARAMREIHRVLRDQGKIVFVEPLRHNPAARLVRWCTPHARTPDEFPLGRPELRLLGRNFELDNYYSELLTVVGSTIARAFYASPINPLTKLCDRIDDALVRMIPAAGSYYRSVVIRGKKAATGWRS